MYSKLFVDFQARRQTASTSSIVYAGSRCRMWEHAPKEASMSSCVCPTGKKEYFTFLNRPMRTINSPRPKMTEFLLSGPLSICRYKTSGQGMLISLRRSNSSVSTLTNSVPDTLPSLPSASSSMKMRVPMPWLITPKYCDAMRFSLPRLSQCLDLVPPRWGTQHLLASIASMMRDMYLKQGKR